MQVGRQLVRGLGLSLTILASVARAEPSSLQRPPDLRADEARCGDLGCVLGECVTRNLNQAPDWLWTRARLVPNFRDGQTVGFRLYAVRPGSLVARMGIANGDTLLAVNDQRLTSAELLLQAVMRAKEATSRRSLLTLQLVRGGVTLRREVLMDAASLRADCPAASGGVDSGDGSGLSPRATDPAVPDPVTEEVLKDAERSIQCGPKGCTLPRRLIQKMLDQPQVLASGARVVPQLKNQSVVGMKVLLAKPGSLLERLGLVNGDTVLRIDGYSLSSVKQAHKALTNLRTRTSFVVVVDRQGTQRALRYLVQ
jgi:type II secretory pathway component PulC